MAAKVSKVESTPPRASAGTSKSKSPKKATSSKAKASSSKSNHPTYAEMIKVCFNSIDF